MPTPGTELDGVVDERTPGVHQCRVDRPGERAARPYGAPDVEGTDTGRSQGGDVPWSQAAACQEAVPAGAPGPFHEDRETVADAAR